MTLAAQVSEHYSTGEVLPKIEAALIQLGIDPDQLSAESLKPVDEFHTGGLAATEALISQVTIPPGAHLLDIGSGLGGTARYLAGHHDCRVTGVDLTEEYVEVAGELGRRTGTTDRTDFHVGSATDLPFKDGSFDGAVMFHVGMNIADKHALFREVSRVLKPDAFFALFDVMRGTNHDALDFPLPWSAKPETSFVEEPGSYKKAAEQAGFALETERDRSQFALEYFAAVFAAIQDKGAPPLGIHLLMGETASQKLQNYVANVENGRAAPTEMIFRLAT